MEIAVRQWLRRQNSDFYSDGIFNC